MSRREALSRWLFAVPALALIGLVNAAPIGQTVWLARGYGRLASDARLWASLKNTAAFTAAAVGLELLLGLGLALVLSRPFRGRGLTRAVVLIPWALPTAVMAMAWRWIYSPDYGVLGDLLYKAGLSSTPKIAWLASAGPAFWACVLADVWKTTPFMALLLMSGLAAIPAELYEAAAIDGAGPWKRFWIVTWPGLKSTVALAVLFRAIQSFGVFDLIWVLTGGGPGGSTQTIALYVYDTVFRYQELGYGCALTLVMAACLMLLAGALFTALRVKSA